MATAARIADRLALSQSVFESLGTGGLRELLSSAGSGAPVVEVELRTSDIRSVVAVLDALQLSFEAAAILAELIDPLPSGSDRAPPSLQSLAQRDLVNVAVLDLQTGSIRARLTVDPRTRNGRRRLIGVGLGIAALLVPPLIVGSAIAGIAIGLNDVATPDELQSVDLQAAGSVGGSVTVGGQVFVNTSSPEFQDAVRQSAREEARRLVNEQLAQLRSQAPSTIRFSEGGESPADGPSVGESGSTDAA